MYCEELAWVPYDKMDSKEINKKPKRKFNFFFWRKNKNEKNS